MPLTDQGGFVSGLFSLQFMQGASDTLRVAYVIPHHHVTGGLKIMCEHLRLLSKLGHNVLAIHWSDRANSALPPWCDVKVCPTGVVL